MGNLSASQRTADCALQEIEDTHASSVSILLKSATELTTYLSLIKDSEVKVKVDIKNPLTILKDSLSLVGKLNQILNQFCRNLVLPLLPQQFVKLTENVEQSSD